MSPKQYGFVPFQSTCSQLLNVLNKWFISFDEGYVTNVIYTGITKAFNKVSHSKLLKILQSYGIRNNVLNWITAFISGRSQSVCVNNVLSSFLSVTNGVPQGSVLGPILFITYINDLNDCCLANTGCDMYLYADEKIFGHNSTQVQNCINKMVSWMENYQLTLSPAKCQYLPIFRKLYNINHVSEYHINCYNIPTTFSICDLGVVISSDLKWNNHISKIVAKASIGLYHISHSFTAIIFGY